MATEAKLAPGHPPAGDDVAVDGRRREHQREVERDDALAVLARDRPDRRAADIVRARKPEVLVVGALLLEEVEHAVLARPLPRHQRRPRRRRQWWHDARERRA